MKLFKNYKILLINIMNNNIGQNFFKLVIILSVIDLASRYMTNGNGQNLP